MHWNCEERLHVNHSWELIKGLMFQDQNMAFVLLDCKDCAIMDTGLPSQGKTRENVF